MLPPAYPAYDLRVMYLPYSNKKPVLQLKLRSIDSQSTPLLSSKMHIVNSIVSLEPFSW